jgi:hypothetical protein
MYDGFMREELERFVASLAIPDDRKAVVLAELLDHVACAREAALREGADADAAARAALGDLETLRASLEAVEPAFAITRRHAVARGIVASLLVAIVIDQGGAIMAGVVGVLVAIAVAVVVAPPRGLELLRAELRAQRGVRGTPIGPALAYAFTVMSGPFVVWIGLIVQRGLAGDTDLEVPISAFAVMATVLVVLLVESIRARRQAIA